MKNFKKLFASLAIVAMLASTVPTAVLGTGSYSDELEGAYDYAYGIGITTQSNIDIADMYGSLIRSHMAKMMVNYATEVLGRTPDTSKECAFTDIANETEELHGYIREACQLGLMGVGIDSFNPNGLVTRAQFGTVLSRALYGDVYNDGNPYYVNHLNALKDAGIMNYIDNPNQNEIRRYVMRMMQRADEGTWTPEICTTPENVLSCSLGLDTCPAECMAQEEAISGFVTVSPVGSITTTNVAYNAVDKNIGKIKITAGENDSTVSSVVIRHSGLGNDADIEGIKLSLNGIDVTNERYISSSSHTATLRFAPALELKAGSSMTFDVLVSLSGAENNRHDFAVEAVNVVNGTADGLPFDLGTLLTTSYSIGNITTTLVGWHTIKAGDLQEIILSLQMLPNKAATIKGFTITRDAGENFTKVLTNVKAYYNDVVVGTVTVEDEKIVVNDLDIDRLNWESATIYLKADGIYIGTAGDITWSIAANDVFAIEQNTSERMRSDLDAGVLINVGNVDMTLTKMSTGSLTVAPGTSSVELLNVKLSSNIDFEVSNFSLNFLTGGLSLANFVDDTVTAYIDGVDYEITTGTTEFSTSADRFLVGNGDSATIRVVGNLKSDATTGVQYKMEFKVSEIKNIDNGNTIDNLTFSKAGDIVTVNNGTFTVTKPSTVPTNKTVLEGSASDMLYFNLKAIAENQTLKSVKVTSTVGFTGYATQIALMQGDSTIVTESDPADLSGLTYTFDNLSRSLTKGTSVPFTVRVTLKNGEVTTLGTNVQLSIAVNTDVVVDRAGTTTHTTSSSAAVLGTTYQISSSLPVISLPVQDGIYTTLDIQNTSNYDVVLVTVKADMKADYWANGFVNWAGTGYLMDAIGGLVLSTGSVIPGTNTFTLGDQVGADTTLERFIKLDDPQHSVLDTYYTVTVTELEFYYLDTANNNTWAVITETYNVIK